LKHEFPEIKGFSRRNLYAMRQWYEFYSQKYQFVPQSVAQLPWGHNRLIITKIKDIEIAEFYCAETAKNGWDIDELYELVNNTNTWIEEEKNSYTVIGVNKNSQGNALQMANYFYETGIFHYTQPNFHYFDIE